MRIIKKWKKNKELQEKDQEKQEALKELEKRSHTLELQHEELFSEMTNLSTEQRSAGTVPEKEEKVLWAFLEEDSAASSLQPLSLKSPNPKSCT